MASINKKSEAKNFTHEGGIASTVGVHEKLQRAVLSTFLWENNFYEDGVDIASRIKDLILKDGISNSKEVLYKAKFEQKLRHIPLFMLVCFAENDWLKKEDVKTICTRPDDMTELLALYWKDGKKPLSKQLQKGLALAFKNFKAYDLAKYNRAKEVKLADILKLCHPKPKDKEQADLWKSLLENKLEAPDTWEVALSTGGDKKETFERLITEKKLGDLAFIRNLRNMISAGVKESVVIKSFEEREWKYILPFQFITAAKWAPSYEQYIENAMLKCLDGIEKSDKTVSLLVDCSGSMSATLSGKSELSRFDAAVSMAILAREVFSRINIFKFNSELNDMRARRGFALRDEFGRYGGSTQMWRAIRDAASKKGHTDLMIVITDEQTEDSGSVNDADTDLLCIMNIANNNNGVGYGKGSTHISGWSESLITYLLNFIKN